MVIKSRALLPTPPLKLAGEELEEDPAEQLIRQLKLYKQFKDSADWLNSRLDAGLRSYLRVAPPRQKAIAKLDLTGRSAESLYLAMQTVVAQLAERQESVTVAVPRKLTIEGQIEKLRHHSRHTPSSFPFSDLLSDEVSMAELGVTLLAVLELIKREEISAEQNDLFAPITLARIGATASP